MTDTRFDLTTRLAALPYFEPLPIEHIELLTQRARQHRFAPDETLIWQETPTAGLWLIESGRVKISRLSPEGREHVIALAGPGDSFNEVSALDAQLNPASVVALSAGIAWSLATDVIQAEMDADSRLARHMVLVMCQRTRQLVQKIEDLTLCSATARLSRFILEQESNHALSGPGITRTIVAAHLALAPETVSRALRTLEEIGAIRADRQTITILRRDLLDSMAME